MALETDEHVLNTAKCLIQRQLSLLIFHGTGTGLTRLTSSEKVIWERQPLRLTRHTAPGGQSASEMEDAASVSAVVGAPGDLDGNGRAA